MGLGHRGGFRALAPWSFPVCGGIGAWGMLWGSRHGSGRQAGGWGGAGGLGTTCVGPWQGFSIAVCACAFARWEM